MSAAPLGWLGRLFDVAADIRSVMERQQKMAGAIENLTRDLNALKAEVERLKAREELLIEKAKSAASSAASAVVVTTIADLSRRLGGMETQIRSLPP